MSNIYSGKRFMELAHKKSWRLMFCSAYDIYSEFKQNNDNKNNLCEVYEATFTKGSQNDIYAFNINIPDDSTVRILSKELFITNKLIITGRKIPLDNTRLYYTEYQQEQLNSSVIKQICGYETFSSKCETSILDILRDQQRLSGKKRKYTDDTKNDYL